MAKFLGRFKCTDIIGSLRRRDSSEETFLSKTQSESESDTPMLDQYARDFGASPMGQFVAASNARNRVSGETEEPESVMSRQHAGELSPMENFRRTSDQRHRIGKHARRS
jgi:hypothetical protein